MIAAHRKSENKIYLKGGAQIIYLTADNERHIDRLRGMEIASFWDDEGRLSPSYLWQILLTRLRDKNGPLRGWTTTTPHGYDWLYYYFVKKQNPRTKEPFKNVKDYEWFSGTMMDNPHTPKEWKDNLLNQLSGKFRRQEIYGEFTGFEGQVYDNFRHADHIKTATKLVPKFKEMIIGIDFGFTNPTAIYVIGLDSDDRAYIIDEFYKKRYDIETIGQWLLARIADYPLISAIYADPSEPMLINKLQSMGLNVIKANNKVMPGINFVYSMFEIQKDGMPRIFISSKCSSLIDEINAYRYAEIKEGRQQKEEPIKENDHACDAIRYALYTHLQTRGTFTLLEDKDGVFF